MLIEILHINGTQNDIHNGYSDKATYPSFISSLAYFLEFQHQVHNAEILYKPNLMIEPDIEPRIIAEPDKQLEDRLYYDERLPFLRLLHKRPVYVIPESDKISHDRLLHEHDKIIEKHDEIWIGGKYLYECVSSVANGIMSRFPQKRVVVGLDISHIGTFTKRHPDFMKLNVRRLNN